MMKVKELGEDNNGAQKEVNVGFLIFHLKLSDVLLIRSTIASDVLVTSY